MSQRSPNKRSRVPSTATAAPVTSPARRLKISSSTKSSPEKSTKSTISPAKSKSNSSTFTASATNASIKVYSYEFIKRFLNTIENLVSLTSSELKFHSIIQPFIPLNENSDFNSIINSLIKSQLIDKNIFNRIELQLNALENSSLPINYRGYNGLKPLISECIRCPKKSHNILHLLCSNCGSTDIIMDPAAIQYWPKVIANQSKIELKLTEIANDEKSNKSNESIKSVKSTKLVAESKESTKEIKKPIINSKVKKNLKFTDSATASTTTATGNKGIPESELLNYRIRSAGRSIDYLLSSVNRSKRADFQFHGGDVIFLLRNAIFRAESPISELASTAVNEMITKWNKSKAAELDDDSEPDHLLVYVEEIHAEYEMKLRSPEEFNRIRRIIQTCMKQHSIEDLVRFDPANRHSLPMTSCGYCIQCGQFAIQHSQKLCKQMKKNSNESKESSSSSAAEELIECGESLVKVVDYQHLCEALVWTSVFRDFSIEPMIFADGECELMDVLKFIPLIRPYQSLNSLGLSNYQCQCYFLTHLIFILSQWGGIKLSYIKQYFLEEFIFLTTNLDIIIQLNDPELVGEFLCSMKILGLYDQHYINNRGHLYLLANEKNGNKNSFGSWTKSNELFHKRYHTSYCALIGLNQPKFNNNNSDGFDKIFPKEWKKFFDHPS